MATRMQVEITKVGSGKLIDGQSTCAVPFGATACRISSLRLRPMGRLDRYNSLRVLFPRMRLLGRRRHVGVRQGHTAGQPDIDGSWL